jgi:hypothetical protein
LNVTCAAVAVTALLTAPLVALDQTEETRRTDAGIRMFGSLLSADVDLAKKTDGGKLLLAVFYTTDVDRGEKLAAALRIMPGGEPKKIAGLAVDAVTTADATFAAFAHRKLAGVFVAQTPDSRTLRTIIQYGIAQHVIVYSPFDGHVESGVLGGLSIGAQVKPFVNRATLAASQITLKPLFMTVAKVHQ